MNQIEPVEPGGEMRGTVATADQFGDLPAHVVVRILQLVERLPHLIGITDGKGNVEWMNAAGRRFIEAGGDTPVLLADLFASDTVERYQTEIRAVLLGGDTWWGDLEIRRGDETRLVEAVVAGEPGPEGTDRWLAMLAVDVNDQRRREADLSHRASHDPLTGLPNRGLLAERLGVARSVSRRMGAQVAVIALDLDGFKQINDSLGHAAGDLLLQQVTARLLATVRPADTVSRYGGDEFMIVLHPPESTSAAVHIAQRMRDRLRAPEYLIGDATVRISASIGVTVAEPDDEADVETLVATADRAMYRAKRAGGDCVRLAGTGTGSSDGLDQLDDTRIELVQALAHGQIAPAFDPVIDAGTGTVVAAEIVPVWNHPTRGSLPAEQFLVDAEVIGHADEIRWTAAADGLRLAVDQGLAIPLEIALSLNQLRDPDLDARLQVLASARGDLDQVWLAVRENDFVELGGASVATADRLRAAGFGIVLTGHGAGGLPLALQAELDVEMVTIDPTITNGGRQQPSAVALAAQLGAVTGVATVAQDVGTESMRDLLVVLGIGAVQGAVTGGPVAADQLARITRPRP